MPVRRRRNGDHGRPARGGRGAGQWPHLEQIRDPGEPGTGIDVHNITWWRAADVNDRALRNIVIGLGERADVTPRQTGFDITAASEVIATPALCSSLSDPRQRLGRVVVGYTRDGTTYLRPNSLDA